jgi:hypothetical protein
VQCWVVEDEKQPAAPVLAACAIARQSSLLIHVSEYDVVVSGIR